MNISTQCYGTELIEEMVDWFIKRTNNHIKLVQKYCKKIQDDPTNNFKHICKIAENHDASKFNYPEFEPYVLITWKYKCKDDGIDFQTPNNIEKLLHEATIHHILNNPHHPEYSCGRKTNLINTENRDLPPTEIVDGRFMFPSDIAEMIADWCAVSEERGNHPKNWADKNVNIRWKFNNKQVELIYNLIDRIYE